MANTKLKGFESMYSTSFIFKENIHEYTEKKWIVTKVLVIAILQVVGLSDYFVVMG